MNTTQLTLLFLSIGIVLALGRAFGEMARRIGQPPVVGELLAGLVLGPTVVGRVAPGFVAAVFPQVGPLASVREGFTTIAAALFLFVAGLEVDLGTVWRQGRRATSVSLVGMVIPFVLGAVAGRLAPSFAGHQPVTPLPVFCVFLATAFSISALPVIARILLDLKLLRSDFGLTILAAATFQDLAGWLIFATLLNWMGGAHHGPWLTLALTLVYIAGVLVVLRVGMNRVLPWLQAYTSWPGGVLAAMLSLALLGAALTEWIGIHAIFGAFLVGVAIGNSHHLSEHTRSIVEEFVGALFAPLFFVGIGLRLDFAKNLDVGLALFVLLTASAGKVLGGYLGARLGRMPKREALAVGVGMNARGAMEIILGLLALQARLIDERLFVALVLMALVTSMVSGPAMQRVLRRRRPAELADHIAPSGFVPRLASDNPHDAIAELSRAVAVSIVGVRSTAPVDSTVIAETAWKRERMMSTALGAGIAAPHARLPGLGKPAVALGLSRDGIPFDSPDGQPVHVALLVVTPLDDDGSQLELLADIARLFLDPNVVDAVRAATTATELLAALRSRRSSTAWRDAVAAQ